MIEALLPFLMSANDAGVIGLCVVLASSVILGIPVFATRGTVQLAWAGVVGLALTIEIILFILLVVFISRGDINPSF